MAFIPAGTVFKYLPHRTQRDSLKRLTVELRVVYSDNCHGCYFRLGKGKCDKPSTFNCVATGRTDRASVKFVLNTPVPGRSAALKSSTEHRRISLKDVTDAVSEYQDIPDEILDQMEDV